MADPRQMLHEAARLYRGGEPIRAEELCHTLIRRDKRNVDAWQLLGTIAIQRGSHTEALRCYRRSADLQPREAHLQYLVGKAHAVLGELDKALGRFDRALALTPGYRLAVTWKAATLERIGRCDEARELLAPFVEEGVEDADMADVWARLATHDDDHEAVVAITARHRARSDLEPRARQALSYHAGRALDKLGRIDEAFAAFVEANAAGAVAFDEAAYVRGVDRVIETFSADRMPAIPQATTRSALPVIIAGMPRSGTTLVEQIIDAHPAAFGAGELTEIEVIAAEMPGRIGSDRVYPECVLDLEQRAADRMSKSYTDRIGRLARGAERIVNKSLENYKLLGLVDRLWPGARVIHCRRDPMDTCLSCFMSHILPTKHPYASDLRHLGVAYRQYERLMTHWAEVIGLPMLEVRYEDVVVDQETQTRRIIEFCGLPWDDACVQFHRSGRTVMTLSYDQVRRPIYGSAVRRHERYAAHLGPLREALT